MFEFWCLVIEGEIILQNDSNLGLNIRYIKILLMSQKSEESTYDTLFDGTKTKLLFSNSKPQIHERILKYTRDSLNPQGDKFEFY